MLFKLSAKNVKKSFKDYAIYFITLILGVAIFYVFNSLDSQQAYQVISNSQREIMELMVDILGGVSVFVSIVLGFLIIYANRFLIKRRKKEFGIYMTLGMGKGRISKILLVETIFIGIMSLVVGLGLGIFLSQGMSVLVANMFDVNMTEFTFNISQAAIIKTMIYFGIMYLLVMIFNTFNISKTKLIDLISAGKKNEKLKIKNPILTVIVFIIAIGMLGYAYYNVTQSFNNLAVEMLYLCIGLGIVGTILFFWSLSGFLLKLVQTRKKMYMKDLNVFVLRQINSKINTAVMSMSIICIMLFLTICIASAGFSLNNSINTSMKVLTPVDASMSEIYFEDGKKNSLVDFLKENNYWKDDLFSNYSELTVYSYDTITLEYSFRHVLDKLLEEYPYSRIKNKESILTISEYNALAKLYGLETLSLENHEYIMIADYEMLIPLRNSALEKNTTIEIGGNVLYPKYNEIKKGFIEMGGNPTNSGIYIVPDFMQEFMDVKGNMLVANYQNEDKTIPEEYIHEINDKINEQNYENKYYSVNTKIDVYNAGAGLGGMVTFIGLYLGIIFLISSAAILALKELSESSDSKERYQVLRKIGAEEKMINKALFRQIAIFFAMPLMLAIVHSIFGITVAKNILESMGKQDLVYPIILTSIIIVLIYGGYFLITYFSSKRIISESSNN